VAGARAHPLVRVCVSPEHHPRADPRNNHQCEHQHRDLEEMLAPATRARRRATTWRPTGTTGQQIAR